MNDFSTNISPKPLSQDEIQSSCLPYMTGKGVNIGILSKNRSKIASQLLPAYTVNVEGQGILPQNACSIPSKIQNVYKHAARTQNCHYARGDIPDAVYDQEFTVPNRNIDLPFGNAKGRESINKGCAIKFAHDDSLNGNIYDSGTFPGVLDDLHRISEYENIRNITLLKQEVRALTRERNWLRDIEKPRSERELKEAHEALIQQINLCNEYRSKSEIIKELHRDNINTFNQKRSEAEGKKDEVKGKYAEMYNQVRYAKEQLRFVTLFRDTMTTRRPRTALQKFFGIKKSKSESHDLESIIRSGGHSKTIFQSERSLGNFNDKASSVLVPNGVQAIGHQHNNHIGRSINFSECERIGDMQVTVCRNLKEKGFNDMLSSVTLRGQFQLDGKYKNNYIETPDNFNRRIDNEWNNHRKIIGDAI